MLQSVQTPTLLLAHAERPEALEEARYIADLMPNAELTVVPGAAWSVEGQHLFFEEIRASSASSGLLRLDTVLCTVLFTDIVGSTERQGPSGTAAGRN